MKMKDKHIYTNLLYFDTLWNKIKNYVIRLFVTKLAISLRFTNFVDEDFSSYITWFKLELIISSKSMLIVLEKVWSNYKISWKEITGEGIKVNIFLKTNANKN